MKDPETLSDEGMDVPEQFTGEQVVTFTDFDIKEKPTGFWLLLDFRGPNNERASWNGNFHKAPDTDGRKQNHAISWRGLSEFLRAVGFADGDIPKQISAKFVATTLNGLISVNGNDQRVKALIGTDEKGYTVASRFKAA